MCTWRTAACVPTTTQWWPLSRCCVRRLLSRCPRAPTLPACCAALTGACRCGAAIAGVVRLRLLSGVTHRYWRATWCCVALVRSGLCTAVVLLPLLACTAGTGVAGGAYVKVWHPSSYRGKDAAATDARLTALVRQGVQRKFASYPLPGSGTGCLWPPVRCRRVVPVPGSPGAFPLRARSSAAMASIDSTPSAWPMCQL